MKIVSLIISVIVLAQLAACSEQKTKQTSEAGYCLEESFRKQLELVTAVAKPIEEKIHLTGTIQANPDKTVAIHSLFNGIVNNANFSLGARVKKGQVLAEIRSAELSNLDAEYRSILSQISVAESKLKSANRMFGDGISSQREIDEIKSELDVLVAQKEKVESTKNLYSADPVNNVFQLKAPASGIVTQKHITPGMQITGDSDTPLFTISDLQEVWVMANIYTSYVALVKEGMEIEMTTSAYPGKVFKGRISGLSQIMDESTRVLKARIVLKNQDLELKPGMLADLTVMKKFEKRAVAVPTGELIFSNNENFLLVYKSDCDIEVRKVDIQVKDGETVYLSNGVDEGEKIIAKDQLLIFNRLNY